MDRPRLSERSALVPTSSGLPAVSEPEIRVRRWRLFRNLLVFQGKLLVDGLKDLVLGPVALGAAAYGLLMHRQEPEQTFRAVLRWGRTFDGWVDLFGERAPAEPDASAPTPRDDTGDPSALAGRPASPDAKGLDAYVTRLERVLVDQYHRGGLTAKAKDAIDEAIDALHPPGAKGETSNGVSRAD